LEQVSAGVNNCLTLKGDTLIYAFHELFELTAMRHNVRPINSDDVRMCAVRLKWCKDEIVFPREKKKTVFLKNFE